MISFQIQTATKILIRLQAQSMYHQKTHVNLAVQFEADFVDLAFGKDFFFFFFLAAD